MWIPEWNVLVVDDEPDVLQVTNLILKNMEVDGIPVKVHTASSKAEAIKLLNSEFSEQGGPGLLAVAFIDVVMESDTAGLELCSYIRNEMHNYLAQLYIRTGQPGVAPERSVIDNYNITGYFTKVEATEDKLYTLVKAGARQFWFTSLSLVTIMMLNAGIGASGSQEELSATLSGALNAMTNRRGGGPSRMAMWAGDTPFILVGYSEDEANAAVQRISKAQALPIGPMGEMGFADPATNEIVVTVPAGPTNPPGVFLGSGYAIPEVFTWMMMSWSTRSLATLWQQAGMRERM